MKPFRALLVALLLLGGVAFSAEKAPYRNPILYADVPDMSVCYDGHYYYMISTTMHLMPGGPIMRSKDMRRWKTIGYVFPRIDDGPRYDLLQGTAYGQGQWASSIRYHNGTFYVWFTANGAPHRGFIYTAKDPAGPWTLHTRPRHFHDGSLLFDDDGRVYLFHSTGHLTEFRPDLSDPLEGGVDCRIFTPGEDERGLLEGSAAFKHNGKYYLMMISWNPGQIRREVCYRADHITGPYEKRVILETPFDGYGGVAQGCIVEDRRGEWQALIFQDREGVGRTPCLMPCRWVDGWPMLGTEEGKIPNNLKRKHPSMRGIVGSDSFRGKTLSLYWQWNHNPIDEAWRLTERRGALRLRTARVVENLFVAPNTLTQRMVGPTSSGVVKMDVGAMKVGDRAGFAAFNGDSGVLTIHQTEAGRELVLTEEKSRFCEPEHAIERVEIEELARVNVSEKIIYLRIDADFGPDRDWATFYYSTDGRIWHQLGRPIRMTFDYRRMFMGTKFALFNYATREVGGWVDLLDFNYR